MKCSLLKPAVDDLLLLDGNFDRQEQAARTLYLQLAQLNGFDGEASVNRGETVLSAGVALAPLDAAACLTDFPRTAKLAAGLEAAVRAARTRFRGERIEVVYAGCGPFALLTLPLTLRFTPDEIHFTMLDVHPQSLVLARRLFEELEIAEYVTDWVACDATSYVLPAERRHHVLVTETMRKGLASEPQVAVTLNLARQLVPDGIVVPERIVIAAAADDLNAEELFYTEDLRPAPQHGRSATASELGTVFEVTGGLALDEGGRFPAVTITMPRDNGCPRFLVLTTRIHVYGDIVIDDYESGLTYPTVVRTLDRLVPGSRVEVCYMLGQEPGFQYRLL